MFLPAPVAAIIYSFMLRSITPFVLFLFFCIAGIVGEVGFSMWWKQYYKERFWEYTTNTLLNKYTSSLNFLAWGVGGFLYLAILDNFPTMHLTEIPFLFIGIFFVIAFIQLVAFFTVVKFTKINRLFDKVTLVNLFFFFLPALVPLIMLTIRYGVPVLLLFAAFGVVAALIEYLFGKSIELFLSRKLWAYNYLQKDDGHFTILVVPAFAFGGFYFWLVYELFKILF